MPQNADGGANKKFSASVLVVCSMVAFILVGISAIIICKLNKTPRKRIEIAKNVFIRPEFGCRKESIHSSGVYTKRLIPRVIYRTWNDSDLPLKFQKAWEFTERHNPEYDQRLFTDNDVEYFMRSYTPKRLQDAYFSINPKFGAARADIFRYAILYEFGGVYIDIKSSAKSLDEIIRQDDTYILSKWPGPVGQMADFCSANLPYACKRGEYEQWWIISAPKHPFLKAVLENIMDAIENYTLDKFPPSKGSVLRITGPTIYTISIDNAIASGCTDFRYTCSGCNSTFKYSPFGKHVNEYKKANTVHYSQVQDPIVIARQQPNTQTTFVAETSHI